MYQSTKYYDHSFGLSCIYRQWRATSHCRLLHGYALAFKFVFAAKELDERGWVIDFGGLAPLADNLRQAFDHKLAIASDDPHRAALIELGNTGLTSGMLWPGGVGCERFAKAAHHFAVDAVDALTSGSGRVSVVSTECKEHMGNSAVYAP